MVVTLSVMMLLAGTVPVLAAPSSFSSSFDDAQGDASSNVDITHVETEKVGDNVTFTMEVNGEIVEASDHTYGFYVSETETTSGSEAEFVVNFVGGAATYTTRYSSGGQSGAAMSEVSGSTLTVSVPANIFDPLDSFKVFTYATNSDSADWVYEWEDDGSSNGGGSGGSSNGGSGTNESAENIIEQIWAGSMLCIALAVIVPVIIIVIIAVVVLKLLSSDDQGGQQPPRQNQRPPQGQQQNQQTRPPGQGGSRQSSQDDSRDDW